MRKATPVKRLRELDALVHEKVYHRKGRPHNYRTSRRFMKLALFLWLRAAVSIDFGLAPGAVKDWRRGMKVTVLLICGDRAETTCAPTPYIALCAAAVRWKSGGLLPYSLRRELKIEC